VDVILQNLKSNVAMSKKIIREFILRVPEEPDCSCRQALRYAIVTPAEFIPGKIKDKLDIIIGKYLPKKK
jgi:5'-methylthioadenosine phosphorylase